MTPQRFEVGEIAIVRTTRAGRHNGSDCTIETPLQECILCDLGAVANTPNGFPVTFGPYYGCNLGGGNRMHFRPDELQKRPQPGEDDRLETGDPRSTSDWSKCPWQPVKADV